MLTYSHICCAFYFRPSLTSEKISNFQRQPHTDAFTLGPSPERPEVVVEKPALKSAAFRAGLHYDRGEDAEPVVPFRHIEYEPFRVSRFRSQLGGAAVGRGPGRKLLFRGVLAPGLVDQSKPGLELGRHRRGGAVPQ